MKIAEYTSLRVISESEYRLASKSQAARDCTKTVCPVCTDDALVHGGLFTPTVRCSSCGWRGTDVEIQTVYLRIAQ